MDFAEVVPDLLDIASELGLHAVLTFDMLGFGMSAKPFPHDYSIQEQADAARALQTHLGLSTTHVLAHDYGVTVALELLAREHAEEGERSPTQVMLLNGGLFPRTHRATLGQRVLHHVPLLAAAMPKAVLRASLARTVGGWDMEDSWVDGMWSMIRYNSGHMVTGHLLSYIDDRRVRLR